MAGFSTEGIMPVMPYGMGNQGDGFGFGNGGGWIVFLIIAMMFGWGGNGLGGRNGAGGELFADQFALQDLKNGQRQVDSGIRGIERGICDSSYALNNSIQGLSSQLSNCCCENLRNTDLLRYDMSKGLCEVVNNQNMIARDLAKTMCDNTQSLKDMFTQNVIQTLRDKNNDLTMSALLQQQTANITNITNPRVIPSYPVCSPYEALYNTNCYGSCACNQ